MIKIEPSELIKKECKRRGFSKRTIETYCFYVDKFLDFCGKKDCVRTITKKDVKHYIEHLCDQNKCGSTLNVALSSVKFFIFEILHNNWKIGMKFSKIPKTLPTVLTKLEVKLIIDSIDNVKHKLIVKLLYSAGLRVGELVKLKVCDLSIDEGIGWIRLGKGKKDRMFIIAKRLKEELRDYVLANELGYQDYVFGGRVGSNGKKGRISIETVYRIVKNATKKAKINKNVHPHTFRHSFATHLIDNGNLLGDIRFLLGHSNIQTTQIYTHVSNKRISLVVSPYDKL